MIRRTFSIARTEIALLVRSPLTLLLLGAITAFGVVVAGPVNVRDFARSSEWWLAGQGAWVTAQLVALAAAFLMSRAMQADRTDRRFDLLASSSLGSAEYLAGKLLGLLGVILVPGVVVAVSTPIARVLGGADASAQPYLAAFSTVYIPTVVLAVIVTVGLSLRTDRPRLVTMAYAVLWLMSVFPFSIPRQAQVLNVVGTMTYATYFEFGDAVALAPVPEAQRASLLASMAADRPLVATNLTLIAVSVLAVTLLTAWWLRQLWREGVA